MQRGYCFAGLCFSLIISPQSVPTACIQDRPVVGCSSTTSTCWRTRLRRTRVLWAIVVSPMAVLMWATAADCDVLMASPTSRTCLPFEAFPRQSCDAGASVDQKCRPLTHFCYTVTEPGWRSSLCCPRPCRDPTPLFVNGQCLSMAHREEPCQIDQQVSVDERKTESSARAA